jgi:hypothetical protein
MKDFNIAKYLKENHLGSHSILGKYVDLHALKEEEVGNNKPVSKVPYDGAEEKLDGFGDEFDQVAPVEEDFSYDDDTDDVNPFPSIIDGNDQEETDDTRMMDLGGDQIEQGIISLLDDGFDAKDIVNLVKYLLTAQLRAKSQGKQF